MAEHEYWIKLLPVLYVYNFCYVVVSYVSTFTTIKQSFDILLVVIIIQLYHQCDKYSMSFIQVYKMIKTRVY